MVSPLLQFLSARREVGIQTSCSFLRLLLTPYNLVLVLNQKTKSLKKTSKTTQLLVTILEKQKPFTRNTTIKSALQVTLAYKVIPYLISGMKRCVKIFDSTFSIYDTFCFTTFVFTPAICFLLRHNALLFRRKY